MLNNLKKHLSLVVVATGLAMGQSVSAETINFDSLVAGAAAQSDPTAISLGVTFHNAAWLPSLDSDGIGIPGSEHWQIDTSVADLVTAENTLKNGYGAAASGQNALDARWSPILMDFATATNLSNFSVSLPDSYYGNLSQSNILFLDSKGNTLFDLGYFQGQPLATISLNTQLQGVKDILLASGTFYDNINVAAVPVPGAIWLFGSAMLGLVGFRTRKL